MNKDSKTFHILVGIDYSALSHEALREALKQAAFHEHTVIHALHVAQVAATYSHSLFAPSPLLTDGCVPRALDRLERFVARERHAYRGEHPDAPESRVDFISHIRVADPSHDIAELAGVLNVDLIIVATHGRTGLARLLLGSVARDLVTAAPCPVLVVRECTSRSKPQVKPRHNATDGTAHAG